MIQNTNQQQCNTNHNCQINKLKLPRTPNFKTALVLLTTVYYTTINTVSGFSPPKSDFSCDHQPPNARTFS